MRLKAHHFRHAAGHVGVAAEIEEDLPGEGERRQDQRRGAENAGIVVDAIHVEREIIGQRQFLEQADQEERKPVGEVVQSKRRRLLELRQHLPRPLDRPGHELREEADERGEAQEVPLARHPAQVEVDGVTHRLKGEERDADRQDVGKAVRHEGGGIGQMQRRCEAYAESAFRFSTTNRAYLKKSSSARLLTMLMNSQSRRLASHAPTAIRSTRTAKAMQAGRSVAARRPPRRRATSARQCGDDEGGLQDAVPRAAAEQIRQTAPASSGGQWSINVTSR